MTSAKFDAWSRAPKPVLWDNLQGQGGEAGGKGVQDGGHMYTRDWFMLMYGKNHNIVISLQLK